MVQQPDGANRTSDTAQTNRRGYLALLATGAVTTGLAGCTSAPSETPGGAPETDMPTATDTESHDESHEGSHDENGESGEDDDSWTQALDVDREFWVAMGDVAGRDSFVPSTTIVEAGDEVGIHLRNNGDEVHDYEIPAFDVAAEDVDVGDTVTRTFTADVVGVHPVECELHPTWMWGQLVVLPAGGEAIPTDDSRTLRLVMGDVAHRDSFVPSTNVVVEGEEVAIQLKNTGDEAHDFEIPAFDVAREDVPAGERVDDFSVTADTVGIHDVECELHPTWMWGQLVVLPADGDFSRIAADDSQTLRLVMGDVAERESFFPSTNVVKQGEAVDIQLRNTGDEVHDLDIEAFGVEVDVEAESQTTVSFTADEAGLHRMVCELHPPEMKGQLWVVP